jgi:UDP-N-acetylmuramate dehydrogenase
MNAGAYGGEFKDVIKSVTYYDVEDDEFCTVSNDECSFGYRQSIFQNKNKIILSTVMHLQKSEKDEIFSLMHDYMQRRKDKQPLSYPSAGSVFKRPEGYFAGKLIEDSALKGCTVGGAQVSEKHAGFIINIGNATSSDIKSLVSHIQAAVKEKFSVELECEINFVKNPSEVKD